MRSNIFNIIITFFLPTLIFSNLFAQNGEIKVFEKSFDSYSKIIVYQRTSIEDTIAFTHPNPKNLKETIQGKDKIQKICYLLYLLPNNKYSERQLIWQEIVISSLDDVAHGVVEILKIFDVLLKDDKLYILLIKGRELRIDIVKLKKNNGKESTILDNVPINLGKFVKSGVIEEINESISITIQLNDGKIKKWRSNKGKSGFTEYN